MSLQDDVDVDVDVDDDDDDDNDKVFLLRLSLPPAEIISIENKTSTNRFVIVTLETKEDGGSR